VYAVCEGIRDHENTIIRHGERCGGRTPQGAAGELHMTHAHVKAAEPSEWVFFHDLAGRWRWEQRRGASTVAESRQGYATREECVSDACLHGFLLVPAAAAAAEPAQSAVTR
jgi:hypothetical protein